ncbi:hypothetical protein GSI_05087 [Ganoderma sinense ZZ0214-1]|uniref:DUF6533 domain-containing protein n=1 Tax=Ganoderma sinense ZZ0214-1 TaxID=1077348 RepID=A0A2G8SGR6_9APHY|nr:hypothetical protein GSI_05087 [Ganoderma sinense ZZ0214-1]
MSTDHVTAQEISDLRTSLYCGYAVFALLVYDWLLCLGREVRFIWRWHSRATGSSLVYAVSRYAVIISNLLSILTAYPMSDLRYLAGRRFIGTIAFGAFSALRAYALSDRSKLFAAIIILLALPPPVMTIIQGSKSEFQNLPSPFNCSISSSLSPTLSIRGSYGVDLVLRWMVLMPVGTVNLVSRAAQLAAELLVVAITWWYTYQLYHVWQDSLKVGRSFSSLLIYNGSIYFLFFSTWYIIDIVFNTAPVSSEALNVDSLLLTTFYDPITSILVCRFILALRQFDNRTASASYSRTGFRVGEHLVTTLVPEFATARQSDTLPSFIAPFSHPIHVDSDIDSDASLDGGSG